jgi:hypothetical protein
MDTQKPLQSDHSTEEKIENLIVLSRGHEKILNDLSRTLKSSKISDSAAQVPSIGDASNIKYLLNKAYSIADEVARSGTSDSHSLVQVRGLIGVIEKELFGRKQKLPDVSIIAYEVYLKY